MPIVQLFHLTRPRIEPKTSLIPEQSDPRRIVLLSEIDLPLIRDIVIDRQASIEYSATCRLLAFIIYGSHTSADPRLSLIVALWTSCQLPGSWIWKDITPDCGSPTHADLFWLFTAGPVWDKILTPIKEVMSVTLLCIINRRPLSYCDCRSMDLCDGFGGMLSLF